MNGDANATDDLHDLTKEDRFAFGKNWASFLESMNEDRIKAATDSMKNLLGCDSLDDKRMLDAGSGSGLFSLSAHRLGACVVSFDYDLDSVECARELRERFAGGEHDSNWRVEPGSLLDDAYLASLGFFDVVYCWGVAHHTGDMATALENLTDRVSPGGLLVIAIYNDQQFVSRLWTSIKKVYQRLPSPLQPILVGCIGASLFMKRLMMTCIASAIRLISLRNPFTPFQNWLNESQGRGMAWWHDLVDWVGGYPFEVAKPETIFRFYRDRGFQLTEMITCGGHGCNEFVFQKM